MSGLSLCNPYLWEDPRYLVTSIHKTNITCASEMVNKACFVYIIAMLLAFLISSLIPTKGLYIVMGVVATIYLLPTFLRLRELETVRNTYTPTSYTQTNSRVVHKEGFKDDTSVSNPFENVTVDQYRYDPKREKAERNTDLDAFFRVQWSSDPTDVFGKTQSQRMFYTTPNTTIPNDQQSYQNWLYKIPGHTCKEGNGKACVNGTNGSVMPWLNL